MVTRERACLVLAGAVGAAWLRGLPFPDHNALLELVRIERPAVFYAVKGCYTVMLFTTPYIVCSVVASLTYIFADGRSSAQVASVLPPYPELADRARLAVVIGEVHHAKKPGPAENSHCLTIPELGLYTGVAVFGAVGSGKTKSCMVPFADQIVDYRSHVPVSRFGGLVL